MIEVEQFPEIRAGDLVGSCEHVSSVATPESPQEVGIRVFDRPYSCKWHGQIREMKAIVFCQDCAKLLREKKSRATELLKKGFEWEAGRKIHPVSGAS
jgi:hypothetical protein